jgi:hypothetical protein
VLRRAGLALLLVTIAGLASFVPASADEKTPQVALVPQVALIAKVGYGGAPIGFARSANGTLHVVYETDISWGDSANGVGTITIGRSGAVGHPVQALNWKDTGGSPSGIPGLAILPSGALEATFGGSPTVNDGPWGISSSDGGSTWSAPVDISSGSMFAGDSAVRVEESNGTPVLLAGCCGNIVIQQGFGPGSKTYTLTNGTDGAAGNTDSAVDAATGAVIAGWDSNDGSGGLWFQQVAPTKGAARKVPVPSQFGTGEPLIVAGRDKGPGVFAAYPATYGATTPIRLLRYGGGPASVGSVKGLHATVWGVATGPDGRIWVFWSGEINGEGVTAITRSNKAVTRFEPIQTFDFNWSYLFSLSGDGRLGPLDLLISGIPSVKNAVSGIYYHRALPMLSAGATVKQLASGTFELTVHVTDAGDALAGAHAAAKGKSGVTNSSGIANLTVSGRSGQHLTMTVTAPGYRLSTIRVTL